MTRSIRPTAALAPLALALALGCGPEPAPADAEDAELAQIKSAIVSGSVTGQFPEIGKVYGASEVCTGTLVGQFWVLTASHCVAYGTANPGNYRFYWGTANGSPSTSSATVDRIVNLGNTCAYAASGCQQLVNVTVSPDQRGNNDIALLHLTSAPPVSRYLTFIGNLVESGAPPPAAGPAVNQKVSTWGYGCGASCTSSKKWSEWLYKTPDSYGKIHHPLIVQQGDSGGPALMSGWIWGVNSVTGGGTSDPYEQYGSVLYYYGQMCRAMNNYPHKPCKTGAPLSSLPSSCAPVATQSFGPWPRRHIAAHLCDPNYMGAGPIDAHCCTTQWDASCVQQAKQYMTAADWNACVAQRVKGDWDGDGRADYALTTTWGAVHVKPASGAAEIVSNSPRQNSMPVTMDTNGDGKTDPSFLNSGDWEWHVFQTASDPIVMNWGTSGDIPAVGDYDGDGRDDFAVFRNGTWYIQPGDRSLPALANVTWGQAGDVPVAGDYDGDGRDDVAIWRPGDGNWWVIRSTGGSGVWKQWGVQGDIPLPGDYDGDGKTDPAIFRPSTATWWITRSSDGSSYTLGFGRSGVRFVPRDYDGDGKTDPAYFDASDVKFHVWSSASGSEIVTPFGMSTWLTF